MSGIIEKIKSRGYWEVIIRPTKFEKVRINTLEECKEIIHTCSVSLRGWNYPHIKAPKNGMDWIEEMTDWENHIETWRFYQSCQFMHFLGCKEDWLENVKFFPQDFKIEPGMGLEILNTLYSITEIYEFATRLIAKGVMGDGIEIKISLNNMKGRKLFFFDHDRYLSADYFCGINQLPLQKIVSEKELLGNAASYALDDFIKIMIWFNWDRVPRAVFVEDQKKFLERRA